MSDVDIQALNLQESTLNIFRARTLTKREEIAKHMMAEMVSFLGAGQNDSTGYDKHARQALFATDALLRALDKGSNT